MLATSEDHVRARRTLTSQDLGTRYNAPRMNRQALWAIVRVSCDLCRHRLRKCTSHLVRQPASGGCGKMMESDEQKARYRVRCRHLHSAAVRQMPHLHALGRLSASVRRSLDEGQHQRIPGSREGGIALSFGLVAFSDLAARFCAFWPPAFHSVHWTLCTFDLFPDHGWR